MLGSLAGPRLRLWRAAQHHAQLNNIISDWADRRPYALIGRENPDDGWYEVRVREREALPVILSAIFADYIGNLESALDLLVYQLVLASGNTPGVANYFPASGTEGIWLANRPNKLKGVREDWADRIRDAQPFLSDDWVQRHPMFYLHFANKTAKHRLIPPVVITQFDVRPSFKFNRNLQPGDGIEQELRQGPLLRAGSVLFDGQIIGRLRATSPKGDLRIVDLLDTAPGGVGTGFDVPLDLGGAAFPDLLGYVADVLSRFEDVLGP